jgi:hypothetical protein
MLPHDELGGCSCRGRILHWSVLTRAPAENCAVGIANLPSSKAFPSSRIWSRSQHSERWDASTRGARTSPHPLHGYAISSPSMGESRYSAGESIAGVRRGSPRSYWGEDGRERERERERERG